MRYSMKDKQHVPYKSYKLNSFSSHVHHCFTHVVVFDHTLAQAEQRDARRISETSKPSSRLHLVLLWGNGHHQADA
jgi:hypothetical protein